MNLKKSENNQGCVIFDMDGVLIDSEPYWKEAILSVFTKLGIPLTREMAEQTMGLRLDNVVEYWFKRYPWKLKSKQEVASEIKDIVRALILEQGIAKHGAIQLIQSLSQLNVPMAICSSSAMSIIEAVYQKIGLNNEIKILQTGDDCFYGKPHPEPYLTTAKRLNETPPSFCVVIEDSLNGAISGKAAGMNVIAVPEEHNYEKRIFDFCDAKFKSLEDITPEFIFNLIKIKNGFN